MSEAAAAGDEASVVLLCEAELGVGRSRKQDGKPPATLLALGLEEAATLLLAVSLESHASGEKPGLLLPTLLSSSA
jgi:hypothetical protein